MSGFPSVWQDLIDSDDRVGALTRHLAFLAGTPESDRQLSALLASLTEARIAGQQLELCGQAGGPGQGSRLRQPAPGHHGAADPGP